MKRETSDSLSERMKTEISGAKERDGDAGEDVPAARAEAAGGELKLIQFRWKKPEGPSMVKNAPRGIACETSRTANSDP